MAPCRRRCGLAALAWVAVGFRAVPAPMRRSLRRRSAEPDEPELSPEEAAAGRAETTSTRPNFARRFKTTASACRRRKNQPNRSSCPRELGRRPLRVPASLDASRRDGALRRRKDDSAFRHRKDNTACRKKHSRNGPRERRRPQAKFAELAPKTAEEEAALFASLKDSFAQIEGTTYGGARPEDYEDDEDDMNSELRKAAACAVTKRRDAFFFVERACS